MTEATSTVSRRTFIKGSLASVALAGAAGSALYGCSPQAQPEPSAEAPDTEASAASEQEPAAPDTIAWSQCNVNCGGNCVFQWHSRDGKVVYMESDNTGDDSLQARACLRGRSMRRWLNSPDRLLYPMKRVGKRGEGKFEQISWDEAIDTIAEKLQYTIDTYGNEAIYVNYATGMYSCTGRQPGQRLLSLLGGYINQGYDYSTHMLQMVMPFMYGSGANLDEDGNHVTLGKPATAFSPYDNVNASSFSEAERASDLVVMFGNSPAETRMGGANAVWDFARVREAVTGRGGKIINIDYRLNETSSGHPDEWLPIRPGTDAALCSAIAYEWIANDQVDKEFLDTYCVGYDEDTMPESAKGQHKSYKDYIMGTGYDKVEKTPAWAAPITGIPAEKISELAAAIAGAEAPFICQGWGSQRHSNGEDTTRAICMLPILIGKIGLPGTNTGQREAEPPTYLVGSLPVENPIATAIPVYQWLNAVDHGSKMTATNAGIIGADKLGSDIKFIWNYAGNCLTNQHGDINKVHEILSDESKCEFIVVWDTVMTDSAKYADILLPDAMRSEQLNMQTQGYSEYYTAVVVGGPAQEAPGECRSSYDVCADIADKFGKKEDFTEGRTHDEWIQYLYEQGAEADGDMPSWDEIQEQGIYKREVEPAIGLEAFRSDPAEHPLATPSGKIEIYSEDLANIAATWELAEDEVINPLPVFTPGFHGYGSVTEEFPLYCCGFHHKSRTHSSFGFIPELEAVARQQLWINPADAKTRNIADGDMVAVTSPAGEVRIEAKVTPRIIPGTVGIPQGAWHKADMNGDKVDEGGCVNTLTVYKPTALAKGNGTHSMIVQVAKA
ncbi:DMSO/selenate family reductase complex A subunit [Xiamenia xianingshaonis]|uniref:Molybdopterin-dependent oxidoreductase n=1 Tax=Xiamenia xianingshaonis TaxID=2682776 RepID=A0ABX0IHB6_9ACTN|nr:DMSO/selenate family reductase complex A subunit [Xiamenia xianingshaonis]NGM18136.1 molybdopterin-dependent oxidoreductase [Eggerthellaceae bacterium zg-893]NHM13608.1 molybdopterin-dependent oxidoreductase [Xiamenia xianingshaonis]NHM16485.1 molybdopterin-dependent oxidoreductase [Xiamenia xianingshaonis]